MYLYIELWKAKDAWIELTDNQRKAKINELLTLAQQHPIVGVVPFSFREVQPPDADTVWLFDGVTERPVIIDDAVARPSGFHYAAAWMVPTREMITQFEQRVEGLGWWWDYFEQQNAWGVMDREATVNDMITGGQGASGPASGSTAERLSRLEEDVRGLRQDVEELKHGIGVILEYVKAEPPKKRGRS